MFNKYILDIDKQAVTLNHQDEEQMLTSFPQHPVQTLMFSDTVILYQHENYELSDLDPVPSILIKSCVLLRLAFEGGIPLRGAISYGKYYIHEKCFLGTPIVEAYEEERKQNWSGATLCKSAEKKFKSLYKELQRRKTQNYRGIIVNPTASFESIIDYLIYEYPVPYDGDKVEVKPALCWDDFVVDYLTLDDIPELNNGKEKKFIKDRVRNQFATHQKSIEYPKVKHKIENTSEFLFKCRHRPCRHVFLQYIPES